MCSHSLEDFGNEAGVELKQRVVEETGDVTWHLVCFLQTRLHVLRYQRHFRLHVVVSHLPQGTDTHMTSPRCVLTIESTNNAEFHDTNLWIVCIDVI